ncbi:MAG: N-acetylmuramoyl-L-alanine amidase [bacterium]|nr:N-acetylmuramoyl-L-alanine amidase [bacterium]
MLNFFNHLLPYNENLEKRELNAITMIVLHCTELPSLKDARTYGEKILYESQTGNSGHFYIDRDGKIYRYVSDNRIAHHVIGHNHESLGIELINNGRYPNWFHSAHQTPTEEYPAAQIDALIKLIHFLKSKYPSISKITPHSVLDTQKIKASDNPNILINRKIDPGPLFPWKMLQ